MARNFEIKTKYAYLCEACEVKKKKCIFPLEELAEDYVSSFGTFIVCPQCKGDVIDVPLLRYAIRRNNHANV